MTTTRKWPKARNSDGVWNETGASIPLEILPHLHQTTWFVALVVLFLGLGTWRAYAVGVRLRTQTIQRRNQALQAEIAERLRVEGELEANNRQLEARNAEMERFVYTASHDLKTPLVTIKGYVGLLERTVAEGVPDPMARTHAADDLRRVAKAADTMRRLLEDLLHLSKLGRPIDEPTGVALSEVAQEAAALVSGRDEARGRAGSIEAPGCLTFAARSPKTAIESEGSQVKRVRAKFGTLVLAVAVLLIYLLLSRGPTTGFEREIAWQVGNAVLARKPQLTVAELARDHTWDRACVLHSYWIEKQLTNALGWSIENYWASLGDDNEGRWTLLIADSNAKSAVRVRISRDTCDLGTKKTVECGDKAAALEFAYAESNASSRSNCVARIGKGMRPDAD